MTNLAKMSSLHAPMAIMVADEDINKDIDDPGFPYFSKFPAEIRHAIWLEALPTRIISPRKAGAVFSPGPPINLTQVCRESRAVSYVHGFPTSFDKRQKLFSSCWFTPSRDLVLYNGKTVTPNVPHNSIWKPLWPQVRTLVVQDEWRLHWPAYRKGNCIQEAVQQCAAGNFSSVKEILVWPMEDNISRYEKWHLDTEWNWKVHNEAQLFPDGSCRLVDLTDANEVNQVVGLLCRRRTHTTNVAEAIQWARDQCTGDDDALAKGRKVGYWDTLVYDCEVAWLNAKYMYEIQKDGTDQRAAPVYHGKGQAVDRENDWVRQKLETMPKLRPVFLLCKWNDGSLGYAPRNGTTKRTGEGASKSKLAFDYKTKLWEKKRANGKWESAANPGSRSVGRRASI